MHRPKPTDPDPSAGSLEARLRALPQPAVPAGLEQRLLANIPATPKAPRRLRRIAPLVALAAAACLVVAVVRFMTRDGGEKQQVAGIEPTHDNVETSHSDNPSRFVARRTAVDFPDSLEQPRFAWPLGGGSPSASSCPSRAPSFD